MAPSNEIEPAVEDASSSSGGSFVNSMNKLSTAKGSSSPDSMSGSNLSKSSEVSEDSDPESTKDNADEIDVNRSSKEAPIQQEGAVNEATESTPAAAAAAKNDVETEQQQQLYAGVTKGEDLLPDIAAGLNSSDVDAKSVEALALIAVEAGAKHSPIEAGSVAMSNDGSAAGLQLEQQPIPPPAAAIYASQLSGAGSDQSVDHTVESSISGSSARSDNASSSSNTAVGAFGSDPTLPMGQIHMKLKSSKAASMPTFQTGSVQPPAPVASMPSAPTTTRSTKPRASSLRRGKWTAEEEAYVARVIQDFNSGFLNAPAGTTLRSYLSEKLHCDPMRITKKFTGDACIGKRVFHPVVRCASNTAAIDKAQTELDALEKRWKRRLEMQQRESAKKAAASAAAAVAAATGRSNSMQGHVQPIAPTGAPIMSNPHPHHQGVPSPPSQGPLVNQTAVARTATWLDRANAVLSSRNDGAQAIPMQSFPSSGVPPAQSQPGIILPPQELENQMREVQRLIHEGPSIQQTTAGLPNLFEQPISGQRKVTEDGAVSPPSEPADKRPRTSITAASDNSSGAEDAEALVGFLNSVRASAEASGNDFTAL